MRQIRVHGRGHVVAEPDIVTISFDVEVNVYDYEECLRTLNMRVEDLRQSITAAGLERAQLKTSGFNVHVNSKYKDGKSIFAGYSASHRMHIELPVDKELLNRVLRNVAGGLSGAEINLSFSVRDKESLRKKVLANAVQKAKENAGTLASAAGVKLGKLIQIDYGRAEVHIYDREASMVSKSLSTPDYDVDIEPDDVSASDSVMLVYEID